MTYRYELSIYDLDERDQRDPDCPYCGCETRLLFGRHHCDECGESWRDRAEMERERQSMAASRFTEMNNGR